MKHLRSTVIVFALTVAAPVAAFAQAGGIPSATAPSNSEGTPAATGTGVIGATRVGPSTTGAPIVLNHSRRHRTHHRHHRHHTTTPTTGQ